MWCCGTEVAILINEAKAGIFFDGGFFGLWVPAWRVAYYYYLSNCNVKFCGMIYALLLRCREGGGIPEI